MQRIALPAPQPLQTNLADAIRSRASFTTVPDEAGLTHEELGTLLGQALGMRGELRTYPSGGARYPIETYLLGSVIQSHPRGTYHYHPKDHALEHLWDSPPVTELMRPSVMTPSQTLIVFTAAWERTSAKYGDWSYGHFFLEAGHMAQNILLVANALHIRARPMLGFADDAVVETLDLNEREQPIYSILLARGSNDGESLYE
ncbi:MAG: SagB/ThcOx family dehydrogenase [Minisyncoccia bacterium]